MPSRSDPQWLLTDESHRFGSGWISGTLGAVLGLAALGTVGCLLLPAQLTTPALREHHPVAVVRGALSPGWEQRSSSVPCR